MLSAVSRITYIFAVFCLVPCVSLAFEAGETHLTFEETTKDQTIVKEYTIVKNDDGYAITIDQPVSVIVSNTDANLHTYFEHYQSKENSDTVQIRLEEGRLKFSGLLSDKERSDDKKIKEVPWLGSKLLLRDFVLSDAEETEFYLTKPEDLTAIKIKALKQERMTVDVAGTPVPVVQVKFTLDDIRGLFWSSLFWFRVSDGILVKTEEVRGGPGTPTTYAVLVAESESPAETGSPALSLQDSAQPLLEGQDSGAGLLDAPAGDQALLDHVLQQPN